MGHSLSLDVKSMFLKATPYDFCLTMTQNIGGNLKIVGAAAQPSYNVGYNITGYHLCSINYVLILDHIMQCLIYLFF